MPPIVGGMSIFIRHKATKSPTPRVRLVPDWRRIVRRAWSIRLAILSALFSGAEVIVPIFADTMPRRWFAALSFVAVVGAAFARIIAQPEMHTDD